MEFSTKFSQKQVIVLATALNDGTTVQNRRNTLAQAEAFSRLVQEKFSVEARKADEIVMAILNSFDMQVALERLKIEYKKHLGDIPTRLENTIINGDKSAKGEKMSTEKQTEENIAENVVADAAPKRVVGRLKGKKISYTGKPSYRKEGTKGYATVDLILKNPGITVEQLEELGGRVADVNWDLKNAPEVVVLEDAEPAKEEA